MKKILILLGCVILFTIDIEAKSFNAVFNYEDKSTLYYFSLQLYNNGEYKFEMTTSFTSDMLSSTVLTCGNYKLIGNKLLLQDSINGFQSVFQYSKDFVIAQSFFGGLTNKRFKYIHGNSDTFCWDRKLVGNNVKLKYSKWKKNTTNINLGNYIFEAGGDKVEVMLCKGDSFFYSLNNFALLQGKYKVFKNQLVLNDKSLNHSFVFGIDGNKVIDRFLFKGYKLSVH